MAELVKQMPQIVPGPSDKEKKYDRQLRLWAANGQQALEEAHILLLNSGSGTVGIETLKNLVLPGVGQFTIADDSIVDERDLGVNFFLDEQSLGKSRAQCCVEHLLELNPDVKGHWRTLSEGSHPLELVVKDVYYTLCIMTTAIDPSIKLATKEFCFSHKIPLISVNSLGFYSYFHIELPGNFPIVDTHPDSTATTDLRLLVPWPELSQFAADMTSNLEFLSAHHHGHIPYVVILLYHLKQWKEAHGGKLPHTHKDKIEFRKMVAEAARTDNAEGGEENYDEAVAAVLKTITLPALNNSVREVFDYVPDVDEAKSSFWIITDAVKKFYSLHGVLPLPGSVPDMKAQSEVYVKLQNIYKKKAREDRSEILSYVRAYPGGVEVDAEEVNIYCKNAAFIKLIRSNDVSQANLQDLADTELNAEFALAPTLLPIYLALKAAEVLPPAPTSAAVIQKLSEIVEDSKSHESIVSAAHEVARARGGELHNISSLMGGMVAQEVIKIVTKQYIPIDNTCVFDGITSRTQIFKI